MDSKKTIGQIGETMAVNFLEKRGYLIVDRNVRSRRGEIDIIAREGGALVFIEVKTRTSEDFGAPAEAVTPEKARKIALGAREYLYENLLTDVPTRCDVVAIALHGEATPEIQLFKNALDLGEFLPS